MKKLTLIATLCLNFANIYGALPNPDPILDEAANQTTAPVAKRLPKISVDQLKATLPDASAVGDLWMLMYNDQFPKIQSESDRLHVRVPDLYNCSYQQFMQAVVLPSAAGWGLYISGQTESPMLKSNILLTRSCYSPNIDDVVDGLQAILGERESLYRVYFRSCIADSIDVDLCVIADQPPIIDLVQNFKQDMWPRLVDRIGNMFGFSEAESGFILNAGLNAQICKEGTQEQESIFAQFGESTKACAGFYSKKSKTIVASYENKSDILHNICHEVGHAFAHQCLGEELGETYSTFFEAVGVIAAVDLGMISESGAIKEFWCLCKNILTDLAPIYENLTIAKAAANDPSLLTDTRKFGFVEYTDGLMAKYASWLSYNSQGYRDIVAERLEAIERNQVSAVYGMIDRSTGEYYRFASSYDPAYRANYGFGAAASFMTAQDFVALSASESSSQATFADVISTLKDYGETCLHRLADVGSGKAFTALRWYYDRIIRPFRH
ncbi:MAG: hypothetical protein LBL30_01145 [Holosporales bacterium]|jgi:hypothetical protein|nr:hypothetical protein [Holosporales bacterium]